MIAGIQWLVPNHIIHACPTGKPSIEDLKTASNDIRTLLDASDKPLVHLIIDESQLEALPVSLSVLTNAFDFMGHDRLGWMIAYGTDERVKKFVSSMVTNITRVRHRRFSTLEESLTFLVTMDASLPTVDAMLESKQ